MVLSLQEAGIAVQTATVSVEQYWASAVDMFPSSGHCLSKESFVFVVDLSYMRYNYKHFNHAGLPSWCRGDSLLREKIDLLLTVGRSVMEQSRNWLSTDAEDWAGDGLDLVSGDVFQEPGSSS